MLSLTLPQLRYATHHTGSGTTNSIRAIAPTEVHHWPAFRNMLTRFDDTPRFDPPLFAMAANIEVSNERGLQSQIEQIIFPTLNVLSNAERYGDPTSFENKPAEEADFICYSTSKHALLLIIEAKTKWALSENSEHLVDRYKSDCNNRYTLTYQKYTTCLKIY